MSYEVIFECNSINNKKIRSGELKFLEKHEEGLYFMFGESQVNMKKRYYNTLEELREDYAKVEALKKEEDSKETENKKIIKEKIIKEKNEEDKKEFRPMAVNKGKF